MRQLASKKRTLSFLIVFVMCLTLFPATPVMAEEMEAPQESASEAEILQESVAEMETPQEPVPEQLSVSEAEVLQEPVAGAEALQVSASGADAQALYKAVAADFKAIKYEDLYAAFTSTPYIYTSDRTAATTELTKELGRPPTTDEINARIVKNHMDKLGMREAFQAVQENLDTLLPKVMTNSNLTYQTADAVKSNKLHILLGLTYLERYYSFAVNGVPAKDAILYSAADYGWSKPDALSFLSSLGYTTYTDVLGTKTATMVSSTFSLFTGIPNVTTLIEKLAAKEGLSADAYLQKTSNAAIADVGKKHSFFSKAKTDANLQSYLIPLLSLPSESIYMISTDYTTMFGLTSTYGGADAAAFQSGLSEVSTAQQEFLEFWERISSSASKLDHGQDIVLWDTLARGESTGSSISARWSAEYGPNADPGVKEFVTPMKQYVAFQNCNGVAGGTSSVRFYMSQGLTDGGINTYTHELTHIYDETVWLNGYGRRATVNGETFARGIFEAENNTQKEDGGASQYNPYFNLNTAYTLGDKRLQNESPERFQTAADIQEYMQGVMDVIYTLDIIEAQEILKMNNADKAILFNKVSLAEDDSDTVNSPKRKVEIFENITETEAAQLKTIDDLVDQGIVSGRLAPKGLVTTTTLGYNDSEYLVVPMFEGVYGGLQNDEGAVGGFLFRRYAHELLAEYGWEKGFVSYISNQYSNDKDALTAILDKKYNGSMAAFKKDMFQQRLDNMDQLKGTDSYADVDAMRTAISKALETDLNTIKTQKANGNQHYIYSVKETRNIKKEIFREYLLQTNDFKASIYESSGTETPDPETPTPEPDPEPETPTPEPDPEPGTPTPEPDPEPETPTPEPDPEPETPTPEPIKPVTKPPTVAAQRTVTADLYGYDDIQVKWSGQSVAGYTVKYLVQYRKGSGGWVTLSNGTTALSMKKANLADGAGYAFKVTPYVTFNGKNCYGTAKTTSHLYTLKKIGKPKAKKASKKYIRLSWTNISGETGYQIARSTKKSKGFKVVKTVNYKYKNVKLKTTRKKNYYYKIRAYKTVNGKKIYGPWSSVRKYKLK